MVWMIIATIFMMCLMLVTLYPASYEEPEEPKLCFELENGKQIYALEDSYVKIKKNDKLKVVIDGENCKEMIFCNQRNIKTNEKYYYALYIGSEIYFEEVGEYSCLFVLEKENGESACYEVRILVE